jgi:type VI secretion system protein ImpL
VLLSGQGLASPIPRVLALRMRRHRLATLVAAGVAMCWCVGLGVSWWHLRSDARTLAGVYDSLTLARTTYSESGKSDADVTKVLGTASDALMKVPRWHLNSVFMPLSYLTLERELDDGQRHVLLQLVFAPLHDRFVQRLGQSPCATDAASDKDDTEQASARPQDLPEYIAGIQLVERTAQLEHQVSLYDDLVRAGNGNVTMLAQLMREAAGVKLAPEHIVDRSGLDDAVRETAFDGGTVGFSGAQAIAARQRTSLCFEQSFDAWFDRVYSDSTLTTNAAQIQTALTALQTPGAAPSDAALTTLASRIDTLATEIDTADHGWASARGKDLVPGLSAMFESAQGLQLIGAASVHAVLAHERAQQNAFAARWLTEGNLPGVLSTTPASGLQLAADLPPLRDALRTLLVQPFVAASAQADGAIRSIDAGAVQRALAVLPAYRQYVAGALAEAPEAYRSALLKAAGNDAVRGMVSALSAPVSVVTQRESGSAADAAAQFDALRKSVLDLIAAFDSLGRDDLATSVALQVSDAALNVLRTTDAQLQSLAPFRPVHGDFSAWDGSTGGSLRAFGAATPGALQAYLTAQSAAVADTAGSAAGALDWLSAQKPPLEPADARLVGRWKALSADLTQFRAKSPASAMIAVPTIISDQLDKLDLNNCSASLAQIDVPANDDIVASAGARLVSSARERCFRLQMGTGMQAYEQIQSFFARYLAGRFPFAADASAPAADLRQTAAFVTLLDTQLADAQRGLAAAAAVGRSRPDGERFITQLVRAKPWLDALLAHGADGTLQGMELNVEWRVDRADEVGADQVIEWKLASGGDSLTYPSSGEPPARWKPGLPVSVNLRWAKDAPWQPMFDSAQPTLSGEHGVASWSAGDTWALLRVARLHQISADADSASTGQPPLLLFTVPVRDRSGAIQTARMYMRIGFIGAAKTPQPIPDLPVSAPVVGPQGTTTMTYPSVVNGQAARG